MKKVILFVAFFLFLMVRSVSAQTCGETITNNTVLSADIGPCSGNGITIGADHVILDCQGHTINGSGTDFFYGIYSNGKSMIIIKNCIVTNFMNGIYLVSSTNNTLINNTANSNTREGIYLDYSTNNTLINNTANYNVDSGIFDGSESDSSPSNNILINNTANYNVDSGIFLYWCSNNTLINNTANYNRVGNLFGGFVLWVSTNNTLINNTANSNSLYGIGLEYSSNNTIVNNTANSNDFRGIYLESSFNNLLINNTANSNQQHGIYLSYSHNNVITSNIANTNSYVQESYGLHESGIYMGYSSNNTLTRNKVNSNNWYGIYLDSSSNSTLTGNTANSNHWGIALVSSSNSTLTGNTANSNSVNGIYVYNSSNNTIRANNFTNNNIVGIFSQNSSSTISTNYVCGNTNLDLNSSNWFSSSGVNNTCNNPDGWNDVGKTGCTYHCTVISINSPINNSYYYKLNLLLNLTAIPITAWIGYSLNNRPNITIPGPVNITAPANMTGSTTLVNGWNSIVVYANDTSGNMISSDIIMFNYCRGDTTGDKHVNVLDLIKVAGKLNTKCGDLAWDPSVDMNDDCAINVLDLIAVSSNLNANC